MSYDSTTHTHPEASLSHLMIPFVQHCLRCGHPHVAHWHSQGCTACACAYDPVCATCSHLVSTHWVEE
jgi:hypothetical protein